MSLSVQDILKGIEEMDIYKKDFDIIKSLLDTGDVQLFTKILEEVLLGNLYWSDLDKNMAYTNYPDVLRKQLKSQKDIMEEMRKLIELRQNLDTEFTFSNTNTSLAIFDYYSEDPIEQSINGFYNKELKKIRGNVLYELTRPSLNDNPITVAFKTRLFNAIKNGEILLKNKKTTDNEGDVTVNGTTYTFTETEILNGDITYTKVIDPKVADLWRYYEKDSSNPAQYQLTSDFAINSSKEYYIATQHKFEYINPEDIFFFINTYYIPLDIKYQALDEFDYIYMRQNNIDEDTMKQIKAVSLLLRRDSFLKSLDASEEGGENAE